MFKQFFFKNFAISCGGNDLSGFIDPYYLYLSFDSIFLVYCP
jgi:hypothetical protein